MTAKRLRIGTKRLNKCVGETTRGETTQGERESGRNDPLP